MRKFKALLFIGFIWLWTAIVANIASNPSTVVWRNLSPYVWLFQPVEATYTPGGSTGIQLIQHVICTTSGLNSNSNTGSTAISSINLSYSVIGTIGSGFTYPASTMEQAMLTFQSAAAVGCQGRVFGTASAVIRTTADVITFTPAALKHATVYNLIFSVPSGDNATGDVATGYTVDLNKSQAFFQGCYVNSVVGGTNETALNARQLNNQVIRIEKVLGGNGWSCAVGLAEFK